jgi:hypothetical protein
LPSKIEDGISCGLRVPSAAAGSAKVVAVSAASDAAFNIVLISILQLFPVFVSDFHSLGNQEASGAKNGSHKFKSFYSASHPSQMAG